MDQNYDILAVIHHNALLRGSAQILDYLDNNLRSRLHTLNNAFVAILEVANYIIVCLDGEKLQPAEFKGFPQLSVEQCARF